MADPFSNISPNIINSTNNGNVNGNGNGNGNSSGNGNATGNGNRNQSNKNSETLVPFNNDERCSSSAESEDNDQDASLINDSNTNSKLYRRKRAPKACTNCRIRKIKCDAVVNFPCSRCRTADLDCRLAESRRGRKRKMPFSNTPDSNERMGVLADAATIDARKRASEQTQTSYSPSSSHKIPSYSDNSSNTNNHNIDPSTYAQQVFSNSSFLMGNSNHSLSIQQPTSSSTSKPTSSKSQHTSYNYDKRNFNQSTYPVVNNNASQNVNNPSFSSNRHNNNNNNNSNNNNNNNNSSNSNNNNNNNNNIPSNMLHGRLLAEEANQKADSVKNEFLAALLRMINGLSKESLRHMDIEQDAYFSEHSAQHFFKRFIEGTDYSGNLFSTPSLPCSKYPPTVAALVNPPPTPISNYIISKDIDEITMNFLKKKKVFEVPSSRSCIELLKLYFKYVDPLVPVIHLGQFSREFAAGKVSPLLLQTMLFISCNFADRELIYNLGFSNASEAASIFFNKARLLESLDVEKSFLCRIQAYTIMGFVTNTYISDKNSRYWIGRALRLAQHIGINRKRTYEKFDAETRKHWLRIWYTMYARDRYISISTGSNMSVNDNNVDIDEKLNEDSFYDTTPEPIDNGFGTARSKIAIVFSLHYLRLGAICGYLSNCNFATKPVESSETWKKSEKMLYDFEKNMDDRLKIRKEDEIDHVPAGKGKETDATSSVANSGAKDKNDSSIEKHNESQETEDEVNTTKVFQRCIRILYLLGVLLLHRQSYERGIPGVKDIVVDASYELLGHMQYLRRNNMLKIVLLSYTTPLFMAGVIIMSEAYAHPNDEWISQQLVSLVDILNNLSASWTEARVLHEMILFTIRKLHLISDKQLETVTQINSENENLLELANMPQYLLDQLEKSRARSIAKQNNSDFELGNNLVNKQGNQKTRSQENGEQVNLLARQDKDISSNREKGTNGFSESNFNFGNTNRNVESFTEALNNPSIDSIASFGNSNNKLSTNLGNGTMQGQTITDSLRAQSSKIEEEADSQRLISSSSSMAVDGNSRFNNVSVNNENSVFGETNGRIVFDESMLREMGMYFGGSTALDWSYMPKQMYKTLFENP